MAWLYLNPFPLQISFIVEVGKEPKSLLGLRQQMGNSQRVRGLRRTASADSLIYSQFWEHQGVCMYITATIISRDSAAITQTTSTTRRLLVHGLCASSQQALAQPDSCSRTKTKGTFSLDRGYCSQFVVIDSFLFLNCFPVISAFLVIVLIFRRV